MNNMKVKMLVMDVDGTLTNGQIYIGPHGEILKAFDVKDGYAIANMLNNQDIVPVIITGRVSEIVMQRARELGIKELYQGVSNKLQKLKEIEEKYDLQSDEIAYIGDDLNDLECIKYCGISACPNDAVQEVIKEVKYVCLKQGGRGAVREFIEWLSK